MQSIQSYISTHKDRFLSELIDLLKIPSISADSAYKNDVLKTAEVIKTQVVIWLKFAKLRAILSYMAKK